MQNAQQPGTSLCLSNYVRFYDDDETEQSARDKDMKELQIEGLQMKRGRTNDHISCSRPKHDYQQPEANIINQRLEEINQRIAELKVENEQLKQRVDQLQQKLDQGNTDHTVTHLNSDAIVSFSSQHEVQGHRLPVPNSYHRTPLPRSSTPASASQRAVLAATVMMTVFICFICIFTCAHANAPISSSPSSQSPHSPSQTYHRLPEYHRYQKEEAIDEGNDDHYFERLVRNNLLSFSTMSIDDLYGIATNPITSQLMSMLFGEKLHYLKEGTSFLKKLL